MKEDIKRVVKSFKDQTQNLSQEESQAHFDRQRELYDKQYSAFIEHYEKDECYLCGKPFKTISNNQLCLHWLLRQCKFKKKDFPKITAKYDFYSISAFLRWVANAEAGTRNIRAKRGTDRKQMDC